MIDPLAAQSAILDLHAHYTDAVFRQDVDAFADCFTEDGEWRISGRVFRGRADIRSGIEAILGRFVRVLITFRTPILAVKGDELVARTYIDERCAWKNGDTNINLGLYYERFSQESGRWLFSWRLFQLFYRGPPDLTAPFHDNPSYGPPPGMPPLNAETVSVSSQ